MNSMEEITSVEEGGAVPIERFEMDPNWVSSINERLLTRRPEASSISISCSIYRVPRSIRQNNEKAYDPEIISIGPLHCKERSCRLKAMEAHKRRYLHDTLTRKGESSLERYLLAVKWLEKSARQCYSEVIDLDSNSFVEMMTLDGFFVIEFIRKHLCGEYSHDDPIFQLGWLKKAIITDLVRFENQIPFFILKSLFDLIYPPPMEDPPLPSHPLVMMAMDFFCVSNSITSERIKGSESEIQHLLHLVHTCLILPFEEPTHGEVRFAEASFSENIPCVSRLEEAGIEFRKRDDRKDAANFLGIKFHRKGVIEIPSMKVLDATNVEFRNYIAFEQCYFDCKRYVTAYAFFLKCLVKSSKDVEILCERGIIDNWLGTNEDVVALFNGVLREVTFVRRDFYLVHACGDINAYCDSGFRNMRAYLVHEYFRNYGAILSFVAGIVLLLLTFIQTFFSSFPKLAYD